MEHEIEKTAEEIEICDLVNKLTSNILSRYGIAPFDIPVENIHVFDANLNIAEMEVGGIFFPEKQSIIVRHGRSKLEFADYVCHELAHMKSHGAIHAPDNETIDYYYRSGFTARSRDGKQTFFKMIDEGLTEELSKNIIEELKESGHPVFASESEETHKVVEEYSAKPGGGFFQDDVLFARYLSEDDPRKLKGHNVFGVHYAYKEQRQVLNLLVDKIFERNATAFNNRDEVFDLFVKGKLQGNFFGIAKIIENTFGKGTFRKLGEISTEKRMSEYRNFVESL
jgi:hypothetical protein